MYNRTIRINPARPEQTLPTITAGRGSAVSIAIEGVPLRASDVKIYVTRKGDTGAFLFNCTKREDGAWCVAIDGALFSNVGYGKYEITFDDDGTYWASRGGLDIVATGTQVANEMAIVDAHVLNLLATKTEVGAEESARVGGDAALAEAIANEVSARSEADEALGSRIDGKQDKLSDEQLAVVDALAEEAEKRKGGDTALADTIANEASARANADEELCAQIASKADADHTHDNLATVESVEILAETVASKADASHTHDYAPSAHNHDNKYSPISHTHTDLATKADLQTAIAGKQDVLTAGEGITIDTGTATIKVDSGAVATKDTYDIKIGHGAETEVTNSDDSQNCNVAIGVKTRATEHAVAIGGLAKAIHYGTVAIGYGAESKGNTGTSVGMIAKAEGNFSTAIGFGVKTKGKHSVAIGTVDNYEINDDYANNTRAEGDESVAIGFRATAVEEGSVQIGEGWNNCPYSLQFREYTLLGSDGTIPLERLPPNTVFLNANGKVSPHIIPDVSGGGDKPFLIYVKFLNWGDSPKLTVTDSHGGVRKFFIPIVKPSVYPCSGDFCIVCTETSALSGFYLDRSGYSFYCLSAVDTEDNPVNINAIDRDCVVSLEVLHCLASDTLITLADGMTKRVDELAIGDKVLSVDPETGELTTDIVCFSDSAEEKWHDSRDVWTFSDGTTITTVMPHQFYNMRTQKMEYIADFQIGDAIRKADGTEPTLTAHDHIEERTRHNTLYTAKYNNYFANGILTGNRHSVKWGWEWRKRNEPPPRVFSKMKVVAALMKAGLWEQVKAWIEQAGLYDLYLAAQNFAEDNEYFTQGRAALKTQLGMTDEQIDGILSQCIAD